MTAKEFVRGEYPKARAEKHSTKGNKKYFLIRVGNNTMYLSEGNTESAAWKNAKEIILGNKSEDLKHLTTTQPNNQTPC